MGLNWFEFGFESHQGQKKLYLPLVVNISLLGQCSKKTTELISLSCITGAARHNLSNSQKISSKVAYCLVGQSYPSKTLYLEHGTPHSLKNLPIALRSSLYPYLDPGQGTNSVMDLLQLTPAYSLEKTKSKLKILTTVRSHFILFS